MWRIISNVLWYFPFLGFIHAFFNFVIGFLFSITVVGLPLGLGMIEESKFLLAPGTRSLISKSDLPRKQNFVWKGWSLLLTLVYLPFGIILAVLQILAGIGMLFTIIGIPTGLDIIRSTNLSPINKICVPRIVAEAVQKNKDRGEIEKYLGAQGQNSSTSRVQTDLVGGAQNLADPTNSVRGQVRKCPFCSDLIPAEAIVCRTCNRDIRAVIQESPRPSAFKLSAIHWLGIVFLGGLAALIFSVSPEKQATKHNGQNQVEIAKPDDEKVLGKTAIAAEDNEAPTPANDEFVTLASTAREPKESPREISSNKPREVANSTVAEPLVTPSFSCTEVTKEADVAVCGDSVLASLDNLYAEKYRAFRERAGAASDKILAEKGKETALSFYKEKLACGSDRQCISAVYQKGIAYFISALQSEATPQQIDGSVPMFCRDDKDVYQPIARTNYSRLKNGFARQFGYQSSLVSTSDTLGVLTFSSDGTIQAPEKIFFDVEPHNGGIALLHMHARLVGISEDLSGTEMCWKVFSIINP
jgi:uncharacterized membrane protein YccF (DUF307 family)